VRRLTFVEARSDSVGHAKADGSWNEAACGRRQPENSQMPSRKGWTRPLSTRDWTAVGLVCPAAAAAGVALTGEWGPTRVEAGGRLGTGTGMSCRGRGG